MTAGAELRVRIATLDEADPAALVEVINAAFLTHELMNGDRTDPQGLLDEAGPQGCFLVIEDAEGVLACAMIRSADWDAVGAYCPPDTALYFGLAGVRPAAMGSGAGRALVAAAEAEAQRLGKTHVALSTLREFGLQPYYERLGCIAVFHEDFEPGHWGLEAPHRLVHFEKAIAPAFRKARPDEAGQVAALVNLAYRVEDFFKVGDRTDEAEIADLLSRHRFLVADGEDGRIAGCVLVELESEARGYFGMLSVRPEAQGSGLGGQLVEAAEGFCRGRGCADMDLWVVNLREELPPWYERLGYHVAGTEPWPDDQLHTLSKPAHFIVMSKPL